MNVRIAILLFSLTFLCCRSDNNSKFSEKTEDLGIVESHGLRSKITLNVHFEQFDNEKYGFIVEFLESYMSETINSRTTSDIFWRSDLNDCVNIPGLHFIEYFELVQKSCELFLNGIAKVEDDLFEVHMTVMNPELCRPVVSFYVYYIKDEYGGSLVDPVCINSKGYKEKKVDGTKHVSIIHNRSKIPTSYEMKKVSLFVRQMDTFFNKTVDFSIFSFDSTEDYDDFRGFDYTFRTWSMSTEHTGAAVPLNNHLYSINGSFYYPHEIVHFYTADLNCHGIFDEGIATYFGNSRGYKLKELVQELKEGILGGTLTIPQDISKWEFEFVNEHHGLVYSLGGLIIEKAFQKGGKQKVIRLLNYGKSDEDFYKALDEELGINPTNLTDTLTRWIVSS